MSPDDRAETTVLKNYHRPKVRCRQCSQRTESKTGLCIDCRPAAPKQGVVEREWPEYGDIAYGPQHALPAGRWIPVNGTLRYVKRADVARAHQQALRAQLEAWWTVREAEEKAWRERAERAANHATYQTRKVA